MSLIDCSHCGASLGNQKCDHRLSKSLLSWVLSRRSSPAIFQEQFRLSRHLWTMRHGAIRSTPSSHYTRIELTRSQSIRDLTGQLFNIPRFPTACGGYGDVWKCDWIKDGTIVKVTW